TPYVCLSIFSRSGVTPPGMKSEYLFFGIFAALSSAGYQISVTSVRGSFVKLSVRLESTKTVRVTPTGNVPAERGSGALALPGFAEDIRASERMTMKRANPTFRME